MVAEVEVVFNTVAHDEDSTDGVNQGHARSVLAAEVASLVAANKALRLDLGGSTAGELSVEAHNALHTGSILGGTNRVRRSDLGRDQGRKTSADNVTHLVDLVERQLTGSDRRC